MSDREECDPITNSWRLVERMPTARLGIGTGVINDKLYVVGGHTGLADVSISEVYTPPAGDVLFPPAVLRKCRKLPEPMVRVLLRSTLDIFPFSAPSLQTAVEQIAGVPSHLESM